jgi:hypothetical protein
LWVNPKAHLKLAALKERLRADHPTMGPDDLCEHLRALGWAPGWVKFGGRAARSWWAVRATFEGAGWAKSCLDEEPEPVAEPEQVGLGFASDSVPPFVGDDGIPY